MLNRGEADTQRNGGAALERTGQSAQPKELVGIDKFWDKVYPTLLALAPKRRGESPLAPKTLSRDSLRDLLGINDLETTLRGMKGDPQIPMTDYRGRVCAYSSTRESSEAGWTRLTEQVTPTHGLSDRLTVKLTPPTGDDRESVEIIYTEIQDQKFGDISRVMIRRGEKTPAIELSFESGRYTIETTDTESNGKTSVTGRFYDDTVTGQITNSYVKVEHGQNYN